MKRSMIAALSLLVFVLPAAQLSAKTDVAKEKKKFQAALQKGSPVYLKKVKIDVFQQVNSEAKSSYINTKYYGKMEVIPALIGGIQNKDVKVRTEMYYTINSLGVSKAALLKSPKGKGILKKLQAAIGKKKETDENAKNGLKSLQSKFQPGVQEYIEAGNWKALASMDENRYNATCCDAKSNIISDRIMGDKKAGKKIYLTCLKASVYPKVNMKVQMRLLDELQNVSGRMDAKLKKDVVKSVKTEAKKAKEKTLKDKLTAIAGSLEESPK